MNEELTAEIERFRQGYLPLEMLFQLSEGLRRKGGSPTALGVRELDLDGVDERLNSLLECAAGQTQTPEIAGLIRLANLIQAELTACRAAFTTLAAGDQEEARTERLRRFIKRLRQEYWLSWQEDFYCRKVEEAFQHCITALPPGDTEQRLFVVLFPEFIFTDSVNQLGAAFYKEVFDKFIQGTLAKDIPRTGMTVHTLNQMTVRLSSPNRQVLVFAGTLLWKEGGIYYNTAPVFYGGKCCFLWEKQTISGEDGKSKVDVHRHPVSYGDMATVNRLGRRKYMAGSMTLQFLQQAGFSEMRPIFELTIFNRKVSFALSVCLDMSVSAIIGRQTADIHVLIACGFPPDSHPENICAKSLFLYCDMHMPYVGMFRRGDDTLWPPHTLFYRWQDVLTDAMDGQCSKDANGDLVNGVYIAGRVEDI